MNGFRSSIIRAAVFAAASAAGAVPGIAQPPTAPSSPSTFRDIARQQSPVVVSIVTRKRAPMLEEGERAVLDLFRIDATDLDQRVHLHAAAGFIISASGEILTNCHVVDGADTIEVTLFGNERMRYRATPVGTDPLTDSALLRIENPPPDLPVARLGDSSTLEPGDWVMAIGNPFQLGHTVTIGVVSFARRPLEIQEGRWQDLIQTDASINQGNSGGPLFNVRGEVVGVNVAMMDAGAGATAGIGFAVPMNSISALLPQLRAGKVVRGQLGVGLHGGPILTDEATALRLPVPAGAIVRIVDPASSAARAGLRPGDVIIALDSHPVVDTRDLMARTASMPPGTRVIVTTIRNGRQEMRTVTIDEQPVDAVAQPPAAVSEDGDGMTLGESTRPSDSSGRSATGGAVVVAVNPDSPAGDAELATGDVIEEINGRHVATSAEARQALAVISPGRPIFLLVLRHGTELFLEMRRR